MKQRFLLCTGLVILAILFCGCTSQPASAPVAPATQTPAAVVQPTATPTAVAPSLVGTNWQLGWFDDTRGVWSKVAEGSTITARFSTDGKVSGYSGCSDYITDYQLTETPRVWFRRPAVPEKVCQSPNGVMSQESAYYTDLEWSETYSITNDQLIFNDKTGKRILQFDPTP
ncbi:MAG: META domain-containing protein [Methanoregula sp.]|nr:META domain-containing protein [Methanoregula sp.]